MARQCQRVNDVSCSSLLSLLLAISAVLASHDARAFTVITSEADFLMHYRDPTALVRFTNPAPSSFTGVSYSLGEGNLAYEIREDGWSPLFNIGSVRTDGCCWTSTTWYGSEVSPSIYDRPENWINRVYISVQATEAVVVSLRTSAGFVGLIPTDPMDKYYALPVDVRLSEVELGYTAISVVPEPSSVVLAFAALGTLSLLCGGPRILLIRQRKESHKSNVKRVTTDVTNR
jgi:hypothetical protein